MAILQGFSGGIERESVVGEWPGCHPGVMDRLFVMAC